VRELTSADARLRVADCFAGRLVHSLYFVEYERPMIPWCMALGDVDGETVALRAAKQVLCYHLAR
jgi:RNA polymerase sigma-70 factor (ECF subfamily)